MDTPQDTPAEALSVEQLASTVDSPLFAQIAMMMIACQGAKNLVDKVIEYGEAGTANNPENIAVFNDLLAKLASHLAAIDFAHGQEIVAGALDACRMVQPGVDIICSGFMIGMPQKSKNPDKKIFLKGSIANNKAAIMWMDKEGAEKLMQGVTDCLDILYPGRIVNGKTPKLIMGG